VQFGGAHENERRAGTENLPAIMGFTEALERFVREPVFARSHLAPLSARLLAAVDGCEGAHFRGSREHRLANTVSFTVEGTDSIALMAALDMDGVCASSGSACSAGSLEPSHVMLALGAPAAEANALVRLSLGRASTAEEVDAVCALLPSVLRQVRRA
jgi:cysteine desulfurase